MSNVSERRSNLVICRSANTFGLIRTTSDLFYQVTHCLPFRTFDVGGWKWKESGNVDADEHRRKRTSITDDALHVRAQQTTNKSLSLSPPPSLSVDSQRTPSSLNRRRPGAPQDVDLRRRYVHGLGEEVAKRNRRRYPGGGLSFDTKRIYQLLKSFNGNDFPSGCASARRVSSKRLTVRRGLEGDKLSWRY